MSAQNEQEKNEKKKKQKTEMSYARRMALVLLCSAVVVCTLLGILNVHFS